MKLQVLLLVTFIGIAAAYPQLTREKDSHEERLNRFLEQLPENLRREVEAVLRQSHATGTRPEFPAELREQIREHMTAHKQVDPDRLNRFLAMLPEELRQEVHDLFEQSASTGEYPRIPEDLRNRIRAFFSAQLHSRWNRLEKFLATLPEHLRAEVKAILTSSDPEHRPLKEALHQQFQLFLDFLPAELRAEVEAAFFNGERPVISRELQVRLRDYFMQLLPVELRQQLVTAVRQAMQAGKLPVLDAELHRQLAQFLDQMRTPQLW